MKIRKWNDNYTDCLIDVAILVYLVHTQVHFFEFHVFNSASRVLGEMDSFEILAITKYFLIDNRWIIGACNHHQRTRTVRIEWRIGQVEAVYKVDAASDQS